MSTPLAVAVAIATALLVCGRPLVEDPSDPEGLAPIETLDNPRRHVFKQLKGAGYEVEKETAESKSNILTADDRGELNTSLRKYLDFLESRGRKEGSAEKNAIGTIKLLIAHSWIYFGLKPEMSLLRGATPLGVDDNTSLDSMRKDIIAELDVRNMKTPLAESILLYTSGIFQSMSRDLKANVRIHRSIIVDSRSLLKIREERLQANVIKVNERHDALRIKDKILFQFHLITLKMILQSYIKLFVTEPLSGKKILVKSSDASKNKEFTIPPLNSDQFEQLMLEAALEGEIDPDDELHDRPYTIDDYKKEQNEMIAKYMESFEQIQNDVLSSHEPWTALSTVNLLVIQSWIHMLRPPLMLLSKASPSKDATTLEKVKENIQLQLKKTMTKEEVIDAIVFYDKSLMSIIRDQLEMKAQEVITKIEASMGTIAVLGEGMVKKREMKIRDDLVSRLEDLRLTIDFHGMTERMSVQSYVLDFLTPPYPSPVILSSPRGQATVPLPPLDTECFEELAYADQVYDPDEV